MRIEIKRAITLFKKHHGILRTHEVLELGIHSRTLYQMRNQGVLEQLTRGVYRLTSIPDFSEPDLVLVSKKIPHGIICLISALAYYRLTTQIPHFVYVAIPVKSRKPKLDYPPIRYFWYSDKVYQAGVKIIKIGGYPVKIFDIEKTLADCVKFRSKIGTDVVIEALKMYWREKKVNLDKLYEYAKINRVEKILHPIMETIVSE
jgi:predicted transcriptional regulator of viral defense system